MMPAQAPTIAFSSHRASGKHGWDHVMNEPLFLEVEACISAIPGCQVSHRERRSTQWDTVSRDAEKALQ